MRFMFALAILCSICIFADEGIRIDNSPISKEKYGHSWHLASHFDAPESAYYDANTDTIYVSNVAGSPTDKDGKGFIQKLKSDGTMLNASWVTGLNAPKGIRIHKGTLWVSDIDRVIAVNVKDGKKVKEISVPGSAFLNDIAIDKNGVVYVSDMMANKIFKIENDTPSVLTAGAEVEYPNGLLLQGDDLVVAAWGSRGRKGSLYSVNVKTKKKKSITKPLGNLDGLEVDTAGNYLVSDWVAGKVFRISKDGNVKLLLHGFRGSADIGFIPQKQMLIVPRMKESAVTAYDLSKYPKK
ncbi:SMP-30/gluconolactonase/LRE family protein [Candidatus Uabimicrobium amorphum]|uniref:ATP/GTP-binding protein n=1 Tax=Uabimicrobium amorphum TaxID=2596890 RepID=A0A5S9F491_UABAM|nr:SMP-30/gluconolactonase/LRE family protein [Candidatus Uabimicrobium amorphum]BBM83982.1 ATP/GTP-binding protein [Candidatus Uabimicrobium amorphum]